MIEGLPNLPQIVFWSGDTATVIRDVPIIKNNIRYLVLYMIPDEFTKWRYGITDKELRFDISEYGVIKREYPEKYIYKVTGNPENPIWIALCNFDGTVIMDSELHQVLDKMRRLEDENNTLRDENERLREQLKEAIENLRDLRSVMK